LYAAITTHPTVRAIYAERLAEAGVIAPDDAAALLDGERAVLQQAYAAVRAGQIHDEAPAPDAAPPLERVASGVTAETLRALNEALLARPAGFTPHPRLERQLARRREALERAGGIDWAHAESLAFASILADGTPIRLTGQDTERGTFSQRHLVLHDASTGARYVPLQALPQARAACAIYNSPLSEAAALGFEYGYSVHAPETLVLWEAQFGDFANAGQVVIDQFIAGARAKWREHPALVLLLPHGYEGQGPEHSSARLERYLQLAAEDNLRVVNCTSAAQYFHLLRAQAGLLASGPRPLVVLTPKSLLRHPRAGSSLVDLTAGGFQPVLDDARTREHPEAVRRLVLCSGKLGVDLAGAAEEAGGAGDGGRAADAPAVAVAAGSGRPPNAPAAAVVRVEQLYPFPSAALTRVIARYPALEEVVWAQEEPRNMGAWSALAPRLTPLLPEGMPLGYLGRPERASTAEGMADAHAREQARIVAGALTFGAPVDATLGDGALAADGADGAERPARRNGRGPRATTASAGRGSEHAGGIPDQMSQAGSQQTRDQAREE
jgi:2-oxoglutarate dehydrogenase E1 component